jgi:hypothetical protein
MKGFQATKRAEIFWANASQEASNLPKAPLLSRHTKGMYNGDILAMPRRINVVVEERENQKRTLPSLSEEIIS